MSKRWANGSTPAWRRVRAQVLARDGHRCGLQLDGCTTIATQVHHLGAREVTGDDPRHLQAVCQPCNGRAGAPDKGDPAPRPGTWW